MRITIENPKRLIGMIQYWKGWRFEVKDVKLTVYHGEYEFSIDVEGQKPFRRSGAEHKINVYLHRQDCTIKAAEWATTKVSKESPLTIDELKDMTGFMDKMSKLITEII